MSMAFLREEFRAAAEAAGVDRLEQVARRYLR